MASIDSSLISDPEEHKWVVEIDEILTHQLEIDVETPPVSLFQVPETITSKKPEAYEPQQIALGLMHHFRPRPYKKMEQKKLGVIRKILKDYEIKDYKIHVVNEVRKVVPVVRSCYDMFLQNDDDSLARIFAIDGLFLLNLFHTYNSPIEEDKDDYLSSLRKKAYIKVKRANKESQLRFPKDVTEDNQIQWEQILHVPHYQPKLPKVGLKKRLVAQDLLMVENQIPFMVLKKMDETLRSSASGNPSHSVVNLSCFVYRVFCEAHSPLKLCSKSQAPCSVDHLLHYMYYSIVNNVPVPKTEDTLPANESDKKDKPDADEDDESEDDEESRILGEPLYNFTSKIPREEIVQVYEQTVSMLETFTQSNILIPSASILHHEAGFQFHSLEEDQGIRSIRVQGKDVYLPSINLNTDSDVILTNLVAYETLTGGESDSFPLNEYMGLMCGLIINKDDVKYLKSQNVITGEIGADEVVKLFTGMSGSIPKTKAKSKLGEMIDEINKIYEGGLRMKAYLRLKQVARSLLVVLKATGSFVESSWKIVAFMVGIVTVFMLTSQAYCDSFGCDKKTVTLLPYASG